MADLTSLVAAEYAFAASAARSGTRDAFLTHLAEDAILFRPRPVSGKAWLMSQPARPGLLAWYPSFATIALAGDLGCTTGPWIFRPGGPDDDPIAHGYFVSVWRIQPDGEWKAELDCGISCPPPATPIEPLRPEIRSEPRLDEAVSLDLDQVRLSLLTAERTLAEAAAQDELAVVYARYSTDDTRVYRMDAWPHQGRKAIRAGLAAHRGAHTWQPSDVRVSRSGDLGYVYGLAHFTPGESGTAMESCYLRVWRQIDGLWRTLIDMDCPISDS